MRPRCGADLARCPRSRGRPRDPWRAPPPPSQAAQRSRRTTCSAAARPVEALVEGDARPTARGPRRGAAPPRGLAPAAEDAGEDVLEVAALPTRTSAEKSKPSKPTSGTGGLDAAAPPRGRSAARRWASTSTSNASDTAAERAARRRGRPGSGPGGAAARPSGRPGGSPPRWRCAARRAPGRGPCRLLLVHHFRVDDVVADPAPRPRRRPVGARPRRPRRAPPRRAAALLVQRPRPACARPG